MNKYMIVFSSIYKAAHAQEKLKEKQVLSAIAKSPAGLLRSCSYALFLDEDGMEEVLEILYRANISYGGVYQLIRGNYIQIENRF